MSMSRLFGAREPAGEPIPLVLYTRADCPLCDEMKREIERADLGDRGMLSVVDIASDPALLERYAMSIPVLTIAGRVAFKGRLDAAALRKKLARAPRPE